MPFASFQPILDAALADYAKQIGIDLVKHPIVDQLPTCHSPDDVLKLLEDKANAFKEFREGNRKLIDCLKPAVKVIHAFSGVLGEADTFQPAGVIFAGLDILLATASDVSSSYDALVDLFECIGNFLKRLRIYTDLPLTPSMTDAMVKIMIELLSVLALATEQIKQGGFKKIAKRLLGESEIKAVLQRLDRLTQEEGRITIAQTLEVVYGLMSNVKVVMNDGKASMYGIWRALDTIQQMASNINKIRRDRLQKESRRWLSPPDPSPNYNIACEIHQDGTATWFFQGGVFTEWNAKDSLLWIYGKPGSGKSILMSSIIRQVDRMRKAGLASMAYFYFDFRVTQKQDRRGLLSSLLSQLSAESDPCYHILSQLYSDHSGGTRQPSDDALFQCLIEMLQVQGEPAKYVIIDALDECPNISGMPTARAKVLECLKDLVSLQLPNVHICLSSRPEFDIRTSLVPLSQFRVSLDDEVGQKADILGYIKSVVHSDQGMRKWSTEDKQLVISTLSDKADGMFRWVFCQLEVLRRCFPSSIRSTLEELPKTLDATYEHMLLGIHEEKWKFASRLFQCLAVSFRPLRVDELAEIMAVQFDGGARPHFSTGWQLDNAEEAVLSACSSLITITNMNGSPVVQFSHFSVKEFLTSERLAAASRDISRYHIVSRVAHTTLTQASLGILLQLNNHFDKESIRNFPLADYAARHWIAHCRFGNVSSAVQDATKCLFDREKPHFSAWVWICDLDDPWRESMPTKHPERPEATPLYYAILCGFFWLMEHLIVTYPRDVDVMGGYFGTPLLVAVQKEDVNLALSPPSQHSAGVYVLGNGDMHGASPSKRIDIVRLLLQHNADIELPNKEGETPLYWAAASGELEISQLLIESGANVHSRNKKGWTPLRVASHHGRLGLVRLLIDSGADVDSPDNNGWTPSYSTSWEGHVNILKLLIRRGADVNKQANDQAASPLFLASLRGQLEISRLLVRRGAAVQFRNKNGWTPLKAASCHGYIDVVRFLIDSGADLNPQDKEGCTALHSASQEGHINVVECLIQRGADVNKQAHNQETPLYVASAVGCLEISRLLVQGGANVHARNEDGWTPLKRASHHGYLDIVRLLIDSNADVDSADNEGWTPLHSASREGRINVVEFLIQRGADVNKQADDQETPLELASSKGCLEVSRLLIQGGADVQAQNKAGQTPLMRASHYGYLDIVRLLIDSDADVDSADNEGYTPLHWASKQGHVNVVEFLIQRGAGVNKQTTNNQVTALDFALENGKLEVSRLLVQEGADVQARDQDDWTPLHTASGHGHLEVVRFLIDSSSDVSSRDIEGWTPLHIAARNGHLDVVKLLLERGADFSVREDSNMTPLDLALYNGKPEVADFLSGQMAGSISLDGAVNTTPSTLSPQSRPPDVVYPPVDATSPEVGQPSLYAASENGQLDIVRSLLDRGSDVNEKYALRATALEAASTYGHLEVAKLLVERGADVDSRNRDGCTPLLSASRRGQLEVARLLLDHGADVNAPMRYLITPLHFASYDGNLEMVQLLLERGANANLRDINGLTPKEVARKLGRHRVVNFLSGLEEHGQFIIESF